MSSLPSSFGLAPPPSNANAPLPRIASKASCASVKPILEPAIARLPLISIGPKVFSGALSSVPVHAASPRTDGTLRSIGPSSLGGVLAVNLPL